MLSGNGLLGDSPAPCMSCGEPPCYQRCSICQTRVTLDLLWHIEEGQLHPNELKIPLKAHLQVRQAQGGEEDLELTLLEIPLMLGLSQRDDSVAFAMPDIFWLDSVPSDLTMSKDPDEDSVLLSLRESLHYDRQTTLCKILEAILRRTFRGYGRGDSLHDRLSKILLMKREPAILIGLSRGFARRLARLTQWRRPIGLTSSVDLSYECTVAASPLLKNRMALVNRDVIRPGALTGFYVFTQVCSVRMIGTEQEALTPAPAGKPRLPHLGNDGIVQVGATVQPGDVLVGLESSARSLFAGGRAPSKDLWPYGQACSRYIHAVRQ